MRLRRTADPSFLLTATPRRQVAPGAGLGSANTMKCLEWNFLPRS